MVCLTSQISTRRFGIQAECSAHRELPSESGEEGRRRRCRVCFTLCKSIRALIWIKCGIIMALFPLTVTVKLRILLESEQVLPLNPDKVGLGEEETRLARFPLPNGKPVGLCRCVIKFLMNWREPWKPRAHPFQKSLCSAQRTLPDMTSSLLTECSRAILISFLRT